MDTSPVITEILPNGNVRLRGKTGSFVCRRIRPSVLLTAFQGKDNGDFGALALNVVAQEHRFFNKPVEWFFDASQAENATRAVAEEWTKWLRNHRSVLSRMHILTAGEETHLRISVARHFSDSLKEMVLYDDRARWEKALSTHGVGEFLDLHERFAERALEISSVRSRSEGLILTAPGCRWTFRSLASGVIFSAFKGDDSGTLTDLALAEMQRLVDASRGKANWFLDLREARNVAKSVSDIWTAWLAAHHELLGRVTALAPSPLFPLVLTIAKYRSGAERLFHIHREIEPFRDELVALTSGEIAKAAGV